jgi:hypothetical protein
VIVIALHLTADLLAARVTIAADASVVEQAQKQSRPRRASKLEVEAAGVEPASRVYGGTV